MGAIEYLGKSGHIQTDTPHLLWGLAACHAVTESEAAGLVGNQVEVKMFGATGWRLMEGTAQGPRVQNPKDPNQLLSVIRVNEFEHARRIMSVVALDESSGEMHVFCKVCRCCCWYSSARYAAAVGIAFAAAAAAAAAADDDGADAGILLLLLLLPMMMMMMMTRAKVVFADGGLGFDVTVSAADSTMCFSR